jgi:hypothetical protein
MKRKTVSSIATSIATATEAPTKRKLSLKEQRQLKKESEKENEKTELSIITLLNEIKPRPYRMGQERTKQMEQHLLEVLAWWETWVCVY